MPSFVCAPCSVVELYSVQSYTNIGDKGADDEDAGDENAGDRDADSMHLLGDSQSDSTVSASRMLQGLVNM